jgi:hypothetical protein
LKVPRSPPAADGSGKGYSGVRGSSHAVSMAWAQG